jgi:dsDNA-specific endonuclease/ATPase MutS2
MFAKAKFSRSMEGREVEVNDNNYIKIIGGKHPLIGSKAVPLEFEIGKDYRSLIITGPNTGGKTVALKTVGLLTMMVQSGLHVTVEESSEFAIFSDILVDIGDGQSIEQSLSTFSSHIRNIISIIEASAPNTLVILDELGAGTDPLEGMGLAVSILESIYDKGATMLATTHYSEIKKFAQEKKGFENGCMEFDINTLKPLYRLSIGKSGESNALLIALRLGMSKNIIERAHEITYKEKKEYNSIKTVEKNETVKYEDIIRSIDIQKEKTENIKKAEKVMKAVIKEQEFKIGDCVYISSLGRTGIVCELENNKGEIGVMYMKKKIKVNKKRLSLYIDSKELYPDQYDMDIVLESKENRKKKHTMNRKHVDGLTIEYGDELK